MPPHSLALLQRLARPPRKLFKRINYTADPSGNVMSYVKFTAVMAASITLQKYPEDQKILSNPSEMQKSI